MRPLPSSLPVPGMHRLLAAALAGDVEALARVAAEATPEVVLRHRLGPALALRAGKAAPEAWTRSLRDSAARHLLLSSRLRQAGRVLAEARVAWMPIKGMDLASRVFERTEERPTGDLDLLVAAEQLAAARRALEAAGWSGRGDGRRFERFLRQEAYCWQARERDGTELELHFRLWGMVPEAWAAALLARGEADAELGPTARRPQAADAYLLAAVHLWMDPPPRPLAAWWDLQRILRSFDGDGTGELAAEIETEARRWGLELPVYLAAAHAAALWPAAGHGEVAVALAGRLRRPERRLAVRAAAGGSEAIELPALVLARLLARRPGRSGWRSVLRHLWAHPGVVERETPGTWPWAARRSWYLARQHGWRRGAAWIEERWGARDGRIRVRTP